MSSQPALTPVPSSRANRSGAISSSRLSSRPNEPHSPAIYRAPASGGWRFLHAYATALLVLGSYVWLAIKSRAFGRAYRAERMADIHRKNARRVEATILALQGLFIKVGQLLSILANFLPEEFRSELEGLQDQVPPRPFEEIRARVESELGSIEAHFTTFETNPIASASLVQWFVPVQGLDAYYHQIRGLLGQELDFSQEADHIERIAQNFKDEARVRFPVPIRSASTRRVLTTTFVDGLKVSDMTGIDALGLDKKDLARRLVRIYCQMIFVDGFYHADPHPGNVLVAADGSIVLVDFGAVAELSSDMKAGIPEFLEGVLRRDTDRLIKALRKMGFLSRTTDPTVSEKIIEYFHRRFQEEVKIESFNLKDIKIDPQRGLENILDLRKMNIGLKELSGAFHIPKDWVLLERTILLLYGCCSLLDPECNPMSIIQPYLQDFVLGNRDWTRIAMHAAREMALSAITLPDDMKKYLTRATRGEIEVRVRGVQEGARALYAIGRQLVYTAIGIATGFAGLELHLRGEDRPARLLFGACALCTGLLLVSSIFGRPRPGT